MKTLKINLPTLAISAAFAFFAVLTVLTALNH